MTKGLAGLVTALLLLLALSMPAYAIRQADPGEKVYDYAGLLTDAQIEELAAQARTIAATYAMDIGVVTIDDNEGLRAQAYIDDFYDYNGFGVGPGDDGMLLLIDMDGREIAISTYGLAQRTFYDRDIDRLLDGVYDELSEGRSFAACQAFLNLSEQHMARAAGDSGPPSILMALLFGLVGSGIVVAVLAATHSGGMKKAPHGHTYLEAGSLNITHTGDVFLHTHTTRTAIPKSSSSGGGSGGGSTHRSSSGRSHGGGSRRF